MRKGLFITMLLCCCIFLLGCPPVSYNGYNYVGPNCVRSTSWNQATIQIEEKTLDITCGTYMNFSTKEFGLFAEIEVPEHSFSKEELQDIKAVSSTLGTLTASLKKPYPSMNESLHTYYWNLKITDTTSTQKFKRKRLRSDTISITIANTVLHLTKNPTK